MTIITCLWSDYLLIIICLTSASTIIILVLWCCCWCVIRVIIFAIVSIIIFWFSTSGITLTYSKSCRGCAICLYYLKGMVSDRKGIQIVCFQCNNGRTFLYSIVPYINKIAVNLNSHELRNRSAAPDGKASVGILFPASVCTI